MTRKNLSKIPPLLILLSSLGLLACSSVKEVYVIPMTKSEMAKVSTKSNKDSFKATVSTTKPGAKDQQIVKKEAVVQVYDIGPSVSPNGDAVGPHQYYKIVERSHLVLKSGHEPSLDKPKPKSVYKDSASVVQALDDTRAEVARLRSEIGQIRQVRNSSGPQEQQVPLPQEAGPIDPEKQRFEEALSPFPKNGHVWTDPSDSLTNFKEPPQ